MSDELREQATLILETPSSANAWWQNPGELIPAARRVAIAYLADHPADDAEPVTEEWLREIGFIDTDWLLDPKENGTSLCFEIDNDFRLGHDGGPRFYLTWLDRMTFVWETATDLPDMPTRGHVRRFFRAVLGSAPGNVATPRPA